MCSLHGAVAKTENFRARCDFSVSAVIFFFFFRLTKDDENNLRNELTCFVKISSRSRLTLFIPDEAKKRDAVHIYIAALQGSETWREQGEIAGKVLTVERWNVIEARDNWGDLDKHPHLLTAISKTSPASSTRLNPFQHWKKTRFQL